MTLPFSIGLDVAYTGQHSYELRPDRQHQRHRPRGGVPPGTSRSDARPARLRVRHRWCLPTPNASGSIRGYGSITQNQPIRSGPITRIQLSLQPPAAQRDRVRLQRHHRALRPADGGAAAAAQRRRHDHRACRPGAARGTARQQQPADAHHARQLHLADAGRRHWHAEPAVADDWSLSGIWSGASGTAYTVDTAYHERTAQREPHRFAGLRAAYPHRRRSRRRAAATIRCGSSTPRPSPVRLWAATVSSRATTT